MTPDDDATTAQTPETIEESVREPWVAPVLEQLDLREAMAAVGGLGAFDGVGSS